MYIGEHIIFQDACRHLFAPLKQVLLITHDVLLPSANNLVAYLSSLGIANIEVMTIPEGDQYKTLDTAQTIWEYLLNNQFTRETTLIGLGGGMLNDLVGFCAGCYMRGVPYIQIPTTLLAQVDASIGGKTAVNFRHFKNMIGLFEPPVGVISDIHYLSALPERAYLAAIPELIKYGLAFDKNLFTWLEDNVLCLLARDKNALQHVIYWAAKIKSEVVSNDERESHQRLLLNLGHTLAHALEGLDPSKRLFHGEAVGIGLLMAIRLSERYFALPETLFNRVLSMLQAIRCPIEIPRGISSEAILATIGKDKKHKANACRWILLSEIGKAVVQSGITDDECLTILNQGLVKDAKIPLV